MSFWRRAKKSKPADEDGQDEPKNEVPETPEAIEPDFQAESLEARIMLSATWIDADALQDDVDVEADEAESDQNLVNSILEHDVDLNSATHERQDANLFEGLDAVSILDHQDSLAPTSHAGFVAGHSISLAEHLDSGVDLSAHDAQVDADVDEPVETEVDEAADFKAKDDGAAELNAEDDEAETAEPEEPQHRSTTERDASDQELRSPDSATEGVETWAAPAMAASSQSGFVGGETIHQSSMASEAPASNSGSVEEEGVVTVSMASEGEGQGNGAPVVDAGQDLTVDEGDLVQLQGAATDPEGQPLYYEWVQVSGPAVTLDDPNAESPSFTAPEGLVNSDIVFELRVSDGSNLSTDTVTVQVNADNDAPSADAGQDLTVAENDVVSLSGSGVDPEGEGLTYNWVQVSGPAVTLDDPTATTPSFTAPEGLVNTDIVFELHVSDGTSVSTDTVTVHVNADNDAPSANAGQDLTVSEHDVVSLSGSGVDPEGEGLTYNWVQVSGPAVTLDDPTATTPSFTAPEGLVNTDIVFELHVSDGTSVSTDTVTVHVNADNDAPSANAGQDLTVAELDLVSLSGSGVDPEGEGLTYTWVQISGPSVTLDDPNATTPQFSAPNFVANTDLVFELQVSDGTNVSVDTVTVHVNADNDAPTANAGGDQTVDEHDLVQLSGSGIDPEGQGLSYTWVQVSGPTVVLNNAHATNPTFTAPEGLVNSDIVFELQVSDGVNTSIDTVTLHVNADDDAPSANAGQDQTVNELAPVTLHGSGVDPEAQGLTYTWVQISGPAVILDDAHATEPSFNAPEQLANTDLVFELQVSDGVNTSVDTVTIHVNADDDAPSADAGPDQSVQENDLVTLPGQATDPEGQGLTYTWTQISGPSMVLSDNSAAQPTFTAPENFVNTVVRFRLEVSDGVNTSVDTLSITINADNDAPTTDAGLDQNVDELDTVTLLGQVDDPEGQFTHVTWEQISGPPVTLSDLHAVQPTFTAPEGLVNSDIVFRMTSTDGEHVTTDEVTIHVAADDDAPSANAGANAQIEEGAPYTLKGSAQDPEAQGLTYTWVQVSGPTVSLNNPNALQPTFTAPELLSNTTIEFRLEVSDGVNTSVDTVTLTVNADDDAPVAQAGPSLYGDEGTVVTLQGGGTDPEGQGLTYTWTQVGGLPLVLDDINAADPSFTVPEGLSNSVATFQLQVSDGVNTSIDTVTVTLGADNDAPTADAGSDQNANAGDQIVLSGSATDPEGQGLRYTWVQIAGPSVDLDDAHAESPQFTAPSELSNTDIIFELRVSDGETESVDTVTVHLAMDNDAPSANAGPDQQVAPGQVLALSGAGTDPEGQGLSYTWVQVSGPTASFDDANVATPNVTFPAGADGSTLVFELHVSDGENESVDTVTFTLGTDDTFVATAGDDSFDGGVGHDTVDYSAASSGVNVDLTDQSAQNTGGSGNDQLTDMEGVVGSSHDDTFSFANPVAGDLFTVDGGDGQDTIDLSSFDLNDISFSDGRITIALPGGGSFAIDHDNVEQIVLGDEVVQVISGDLNELTFSGSGVWLEGDQAFRIELTGPGSIDFSYDATTDSLVVIDSTGTNANSTLSITDLNGTDLDVDSISFDTSFGGLESNVDLGALNFSAQATVPMISVRDGAGSIDAIHFSGGAVQGSPIVIDAQVGTVTLDSDLDTDLQVTGDLDSLTVSGSVSAGSDLIIGDNLGTVTISGDLAADLDVGGDLTTLTVSGSISGTGRVLVGDDVGSLDVTGAVDGVIDVGDNLNSLHIVGPINASAVINIGGDAGSITADDDLYGDLDIGGDLESLEVVGAMDAGAQVTVAGDANTIHIAGAANGDFLIEKSLVDFDVDGDFQGTLTVELAFGALSIHDGATDIDKNYAEPFHLVYNGASNTVTETDIDVIYGTSGSDTISGTSADEIIEGFESDDVIDGGGGSDDIRGGAGSDTIDYSGATGPVNVNLQAGTGTVGSDVDSLSSIENVRGSDFDDTIIGNSQDNVLSGGAGDDTIMGGGGFDTVDYSDAPTAVTVDITDTSAQDTGGAGVDTLSGIEGVRGSNHDDTFSFSNPTAGATYHVDGGGGSNVIDLSQFSVDDISLNAGAGRIVVDLGGGQSFTVEFSNVDSILLVEGAIDSDEAPPEANAGADLMVDEGSLVTLNGTGSTDGDGDQLVYTWVQVGGPAVALDDPSSATPNFTAPEGVANTWLTFELQASDGFTTSTDRIAVLVNADNDAPTADAGADFTIEENLVATIPGVVTDSDSGHLEINWTQTSGVPVILKGADGAQPTFVVPEGLTNSTVTFEMTVFDGVTTSIDTITITISADDDAPSANAGADFQVNEGAQVTLPGSAHDPEGQGLTYEWVQVSGPTVTLSDSHALKPSFTAPNYLSNTDISFELRVSDGVNTSVDSVTVTIAADDDAPTALAGPDLSVAEDSVATLLGGGSDPEGQGLTYTWVQTGGTPVILSDPNAPQPSFDVPNQLANSVLTFRLEVSDGVHSSFDNVLVTINADNDAPITDAGADQTIEENLPVQLGGSIQEPEGQTVEYSWHQISGPTVALTDADSLNPSFIAPEGLANVDIVFELRAFDGSNTSIDTVTVHVERDDDAPTAEAGPNQTVNELNLVQLSGSGTDPEAQGLTYEWVQVSGTPVTLNNANAAAPTFSAPEGLVNSDIVFELRVSDGVNTSVDTVTITVNADDDAPTAEAGANKNATEGTLFTMSGSGVDPEAQGLTYQWVQVQGPSVTLSDPHNPHATFTVPEGLVNSTAKFELHVSDGVNTSVDSVFVYFKADNDAPTAQAGPDQSVTELDQVFLSGSGSDQENQALTYTWVQTGGPTVQIIDGNTPNANFSAPNLVANTDLTFQLRVSDGTNVTVDTMVVTVGADDDAPSANAGFDQVVDEGDVVQLLGSGTDPEGLTLSYEWVQVSGPAVDLSNDHAAQPTFTAPNYLVNTDVVFELRVSDGNTTSVDTVTVTINADDDAPVANAGQDIYINEQEVVELSGTITDPEGQPLTYQWVQVSGPTVTLDDANSLNPNFVAPTLASDAEIVFELRVSDGVNETVDTVSVHLNAVERAAHADAGQDLTATEGDLVTLQARPDSLPPALVFSDGQIESYGGSNDSSYGNVEIVDDGNTVHMEGNAWKSIDFEYSVTNNTVLSFDVRIDQLGEIHAIGFDNDDSTSENRAFKVGGTQNWGLDDLSQYATIDGDTVHYEIPVGEFYTGNFDRLFFVNDNDANQTAVEATYSNIRVYEADEVFTPTYDLDGDAVTFNWVQVSGPAVTLDDPHAESPTFTAPEGLVNTDIVFELQVSDGKSVSTDLVTIHVNADNDAPSADAGSDQTVTEHDLVTLSGSGTDPENQGLTYQWVQVSGPSVSLDDPSAASPTFSAPEGLVNTDIVFELQVSDGTNVSSDTLTIHVNADNDAPSADAGPDLSAEELSVVTLSGSAVDPEGEGLTYTWVQISGPPVSLDDPNAASPSFTAPEGLVNSDIVFELSVTDGTNVSTDSVTVHINADNDAPNAEAGPDQTVSEHDVVVLAGSATDPEGQGLSYTWVQVSGPSVSLDDPHATNPSFVAPEGLVNSDIVFELQVSDGTNTSVDTVTLHVNADNDAPSSNAGPDLSVQENHSVMLQGSGTDPENQGLSYEWVQTAGPTMTLDDPHSPTPSFTAPERLVNTQVTFELRVSDGTNVSTDSMVVQISANDDSPAANAGADLSVDELDVVTLSGSGTDPEGQGLTLTWVQISGPPVTLDDIHAANPSFTAPEGLVNTDIVFQLEVSDGNDSSFDNVTVHVNADNDAPSANAGPDQTVVEGDLVSLVGAATDPEGEGLTYQWLQISGPTVELSDAGSQSPQFAAPNIVADADVVFELQVSDGTNTTVDTVIVHIQADDDAPINIDAGADQNVDELDLVQLQGFAEDPEGQPMTYSWVQVSGTPVTLNDPHAADPSFSAPEGLVNSDIIFELQVSDGVTTVTDRVTVHVGADNDAPSADAGQDISVEEHGLVTLSGSGVDPEGEGLSYSWVQVSGTPVTLDDVNATSPTFTAPEGLVNSDIVFELRVSDGTNVSTDTVTVHVGADNDAPSANAGQDLSVEEHGLVTLSGSGVDPEGEGLTYTWVQVSGTPVTLDDVNATSPTFTAPEGLVNSDIVFELQVTDGTNVSTDTVTVHVGADNDAPSANAGQDISVEEHGLVTLSGSGVDPEGEGLTYTWVQVSGTPVTLDDVNATSPTFTAPEGLVNSDIVFELQVSDGTNVSTDTVTVHVGADNDAPSANAGQDISVEEHGLVTLSGSGVDPEGQGLTYTWVQVSGTPVTLDDVNATSPTFTAPEGLVNSDIVFELQVSDGTNVSTDTVTVHVGADNDAPSANAGPDISVEELGLVTLSGSGVDPEGEGLTYTWVQVSGTPVTLDDVNATSPTFTAPEGLVNSDIVFELQVSDGTNVSTDTVTVHVGADNDAPSANAGQDISVEEHGLVTLSGSGVDPEGEGLTYTWVQVSGTPVTLDDANATSPSFTAPEGLVNSDIVFELQVSDGTNVSTDTVTVHVGADNDAPSANAGQDISVEEHGLVTLSGSGVDPEGEGLSYTWVQVSGTPVTLDDVNATSPTFTAPEGLVNSDIVFELQVSDGTNVSTDTVTVHVGADNDAPSANAGQDISVEEHGLVTLSGSGVDPEGEGLTYTWVQVSGTPVTLDDANATSPSFTAPEGLVNSDIVFELQVSDGTNVSTDTVTVHVGADNDAPSANAGQDISVEEHGLVTLSGSGVDPEGEGLTYTWVQVSGTPVTLDDANATSPTFTAPEGLVNSDIVFELQVSDGTNVSTDTVTVHVGADNDAPSADAGPDILVAEHGLVTLSGSGVDPEGEGLTYTWVQVSGTPVTLDDVNATAPTFRAPEGLADSEIVFELRVSDGTNVSTDTVTVHIDADNDLCSADAGDDLYMGPGKAVSLSGEGHDPEGQDLSYRWIQVSGPTVVLSNPNSANPTFVTPSGTDQSEIVFRLEVSDGENVAVDTVSVFVEAKAPEEPEAELEPDDLELEIEEPPLDLTFSLAGLDNFGTADVAAETSVLELGDVEDLLRPQPTSPAPVAQPVEEDWEQASTDARVFDIDEDDMIFIDEEVEGDHEFKKVEPSEDRSATEAIEPDEIEIVEDENSTLAKPGLVGAFFSFVRQFSGLSTSTNEAGEAAAKKPLRRGRK